MDAQAAAHPSEKTLSFYRLGQLDRAEAETVRRHLSACEPCRNRVASMMTVGNVDAANSARARYDSTPAVGSSLVLPAQENGEPAAPPLASTLPAGLANHPDYQVLRELGRGGMGVVYLAENRLMGRKEVLKVVGSHLLNRKGILERFLREVRAAAQLQHPNIVAAYSATRTGDSIVLAMEYIEGFDLAKLVETQGPIPVTHACNFAYQAALGLQHAHERGLVHRDIKPSNLMLTRAGKKPVIKILDFGLAKVTSEAGVDAGLTHEGQLLGTPHYVSPEQTVNAPNADIRADIYSLGCTLYCLLTGHPPFDAPSLYELLQAHHSMDAPLLNLLRPDVSIELAALVTRMMAKNPVDRFQTPIQVAQALAPFTKKTRHSTTASEVARPAVADGHRKQPAVSLAHKPSAQTQVEQTEAPSAPASEPAKPGLRAGGLALAGAALLMLGLTAVWTLHRPGPAPAPTTDSSSSRSSTPPAASPPAAKPEQPEGVLTDAEAAIRSSQWPAALERIDRYLANPQASETVRASTIRLQLLAATSDMEADLIARSLSDQELEENLKQEARPLATKVEIQELATAYRDNMLRALRRENSRRQEISHEKLARESRPASLSWGKRRPGQPADRHLAEASVPNHDRPIPPAPRPEQTPSLGHSANGTVPFENQSGKVTIDDVFSAPEKYDRKMFVLDGVFRIGTRVERVKYQEGQPMGFSLPLARDDGRTLCAGDGKIVKSDMMLLVDISVVSRLERMFRELRILPSPRPLHRSIVGVRMETLTDNNQTTRALVINSLEILGAINFRNVVSGNSSQAFRVIEITPSLARMSYGDGREWVERLGGEEKFVGAVRRKFKEIQRHLAANSRQAQFDQVFQKEMTASMKMAEAQARSMQAAVERVEMSGVPSGISGFR